MTNIQFLVEGTYNRLKTLSYKLKNEKNEINFESFKKTLLHYFSEMDLLSEEIKICFDSGRPISTPFISFCAVRDMMYNNIRDASNISALSVVCDSVMGLFTSIFDNNVPACLNDTIPDYYYKTAITCNWENPEHYAKMSVYLAESLGNAITVKRNKDRDINVMSTVCGIDENDFDYYFLNACNSRGYNIHLYGINQLEDVYREHKREIYTKVIYGGISNSIISNDSFDVVYCVPEIPIEREYRNSLLTKTEREYINRCTNYVRTGGIILIKLPYFRLHQEICETIVRNYENIQLLYNYNTFYNYVNEDYSIYIIGTKKAKPTSMGTTGFDMNIYDALKMFHLDVDRDNLPNSDVFEIDEIILPDSISEIKTFRGSTLDANEAEDYFLKSPSVAAFWKEQSFNKTVDDKARPLLPFSVGQLGLVLTSGCLDGIIDEGNGYKHVVKGRVIKKKDTEEIPYANSYNENTHRGRSLVVDTIRNRVEINAFLPDGTYKCLA